MTTFNEFYESLHTDSLKRGHEFERFIKWFLKNEPEWATQVDRVWLWKDYPARWGIDCGVDLVFKHKNGELWAVQAKCYSPEYSITKNDIDTFLSESNRHGIDKRLLIVTTDRIGANARQVCDAQEKLVVRYLLSNFIQAQVEYPTKDNDLSCIKRKEIPAPRKHQLEAIDTVVNRFDGADRGQLIMACGTGKTFTTLWIKERLKAQRTLVLLPSLGLLSQTLREWTFAASKPYAALCVCSDQTVGSVGDDEAIHSVADLAFPVTSSPEDIKKFLKRDGPSVIFSTYQSSPLVAQAQKIKSVPAFDLVIADEAHRCTGKAKSDFATVLNATSIRSVKRLFTTATPRTYSTAAKSAAEGRGIEVVGMDDETVFGQVFYVLPFGQAISRGLLTDYRVVIIGVDDPTIAEWIKNRELIATDSGFKADSEALAGQIGLLKAIKDFSLKRIITFHGRVNRAESFSQNVQEILGLLEINQRPKGAIWSDFVSGLMPAEKRRQKLDRLKELATNETGILANARCLSEGVDVPSLDGVAFIDPRRSHTDIVQAVGRAIRLSKEKVIGTIIIPVFIEAGDDTETAIEASNFKPVWDVLNALKAHDNVLSDELDKIRTELGEKNISRVSSGCLEKLVIDLPSKFDNNFAEAIRTQLVEQSTESWMFWYGLLTRFCKKHGHCRVAQDFKTDDDYRLGGWVSKQRSSKESLSNERRERLEALPRWSWDVLTDQWEEGFQYLEVYSKDHRNCLVPALYKSEDGYRLGQWVRVQRVKMDELTTERRERLEALPKWSWDLWVDQWEVGFQRLKKYAEENGHCFVPATYEAKDGHRLGRWLVKQRRNNQLSQKQKKRLESLPKWSWTVRSDQWENGFNYLLRYLKENGHSRPTGSYKTDDGYRLGSWVTAQRSKKKSLSDEHRRRLEALPLWSWDALIDQWEEGFQQLEKYAVENGNCFVPTTYKTSDGYRLGGWVAIQRSNIDKISRERKKRFESLPKWSWDLLTDQWEEAFDRLAAYSKKHGTSRVPQGYKTDDNFPLGTWVSHRRHSKDLISPERRKRLETLPQWSWDPYSEQWEIGFKQLKAYCKKNKTCLVPDKYKTKDGYSLGSWVGSQRAKKDKMTKERRKRLDALPGWVWSGRTK